MKKVALILLLWISSSKGASINKKKSIDKIETTSPGPAIIAIEIVDEDGNKTLNSKIRNNTKRTIESALGYGYQGNYYPTGTQGKKYMVYPYSQYDIPPFDTKSEASSSKYFGSGLNIQKSVGYNLGTKTEHVPVKHYYSAAVQEPAPSSTQEPIYVQPTATASGNYYPSTLFSTIGQTGQIGGLSNQFPVQAATSIPVIVLRVYTNQLSDNTIYPNLPQSHPYASNLNSINLQTLLANYVQQHLYQQTQQYPAQMMYHQNYDQTAPNDDYQLYQSHQTQVQQNNADSLPTHENYPSDAHTRVIYHGPKGHVQGVSYSSTSPQYTNQQIYTDSQGQSFIYVHPNQISSNQYYQQQSEYDYQEQQPQQSEYQEPETNYQTVYQEQRNKNRQYLPTEQSIPDKVFNYHAAAAKVKDRSKKSSGAPVTFDTPDTDSDSNTRGSRKSKRN